MQRREFIGRLGAAAVGAVCRSSLSYAQAAGSVAHCTIGANGIHLHFVEVGRGTADRLVPRLSRVVVLMAASTSRAVGGWIPCCRG
jgi:hypothetical protein